MTTSTIAELISATQDRHGWITVNSRFGNFEFKNGYPTRQAAEALLDQLIINRAIEVYLRQVPAVGLMESRRGVRQFGAKHRNQLVIWETLMDAKSLVLTANTETVYGMGFLDLKSDGPTVFEAPPKMLGAAMNILQRFLADIGPLGADRGKGGKYLFLPPDYAGEAPQGYFVVKWPTYNVNFFVRGFKENGKTEPAVAAHEQMKVYPLAKVASPLKMEFLNGSGQPTDTIHSDTILFFESLAELVNEEPAEIFTPIERFHMQRIGIEQGKEFKPDAKMSALLSEAAKAAAAIARANCFALREADTLFYGDRQWRQTGDVPYNFMKDGVLEVDRRAYVYYMAMGNSPAMMSKNIGVGSQHLWTYSDADGDFLDGARSYVLRVSPKIPINNFWSVRVYDALSRSQFQNGQKFPSVSQYSDPKINPDGSVDVYFAPEMPKGADNNWIQSRSRAPLASAATARLIHSM